MRDVGTAAFKWCAWCGAARCMRAARCMQQCPVCVCLPSVRELSAHGLLSPSWRRYLQVGGALLAVNYPQRLSKAFLLNAPTWSGIIWKARLGEGFVRGDGCLWGTPAGREWKTAGARQCACVLCRMRTHRCLPSCPSAPPRSPPQVLAAAIPRKTREQLSLFTKTQQAEAAQALLEWVPAEQLPAQYGGSCQVPLSQSPLEKDMLSYVRRLNAGDKSGSKSGGVANGEPGAAAAAAAEAGSGGEQVAESKKTA